MESGQVKSLYLALRDTVAGMVVHEVRFSKDGKSLLESTQKKPAVLRPDSVLFDETQLPPEDFIRCERIGSKLYLFAGVDYFRGLAVPTVACVFDPKSSSSSSRDQFHDLPTHIPGTSPNIIAAHGRLYHLASTHERSGVPMPFEVYDPSTKSWDPLPSVPQCPFVPYDKAPRWYMGYAVWGSCILVSLAYPSMNWESLISEPVLFNVESGTWHQLKTEDDPLGPCFPWRDKAVVVGDTAYALGSKMGSIISFSIKKSGSEEDGTLVYSLVRPYMLKGLRVARLPNYLPRQRSCHLLTPLGDFEFCLVQTIDHPISGSQPIWITTFKIIRKEGSRFSKIQTLHSTIEFMKIQDHRLFWPLYCYNPDYEPKEVVLTTTKDIRREGIRTQSSSQEVSCCTMDYELNVASLKNRKKYGLKNVCGLAFSMSSMRYKGPVECLTEKVDMQDVYFKADYCPEYELGGKHSEIEGEIIDLDSGDSVIEEYLMRVKALHSACPRSLDTKAPFPMTPSSAESVCGFVSDSHRVKSSMLPVLPVEHLTKEEVDMLDLSFKADCYPEYELGGKHSEIEGEIIDLDSGDSISNETVLKSKKAKRLKRKVKCSKKKGTVGSKRGYIISLGPLFIAFFAGILFFPEIWDALLSWERHENMKFVLLELLGLESWG